MFRSTQPTFFAALFLCFFISIAVADPRAIHLHRRDGPTTPSTISSSALKAQSSSLTSSGESSGARKGGDSTTSASQLPSASSTVTPNSSNSTSSSTSATPTSSISVSAITQNINGPAPTSAISNSNFSSIATPNKLPITPEVTPGLAVAGVILMLSGVVYTLVGIKNKWLHIYLSAGYLSGLAVTVLIIYVMNPPISNAIQGAYVVAVVMTGFILGGAAIVFTELTEGLGCLLGGFCVSMWLLVLKPGGLLTSTGAKSGFIAAFTVAAFAVSFSRVTRSYGLIVFISFGGATVVILGIDCFSRAGLKEFWAYIWDLNDTLFPVGATTYPLTRGLKVEIAAIIVLFLAGVMSQMKLWKVIKERREQRASERLQDERTMEEEEENVGRRIEQHNAADRDQWETVYGGKEVSNSTVLSNRDSGVADMESNRKGPTSTVTSFRPSGEEGIEMRGLPSPALTTGAGLVMAGRGEEGGLVTIRVARDPEPPTILDENGRPIGSSENRLSHLSARDYPQENPQEESLERRPSQRGSKLLSGSPAVVPLPFKVPEGDIEDDRSSVATYADEELAVPSRQSKHLSAGSAFLRRLSGRSNRSSKAFSRGEGNSTEDLVLPGEIDEGRVSRASSIAATVDGLSDDDEVRSTRSSIVHMQDFEEPQSETPAGQIAKMEIADATHLKLTTEILEQATKRPLSTTTVATDLENPNTSKEQGIEEPAAQQSWTSSTNPKLNLENEAASHVGSDETEKPANGPLSLVSAVDSKPTSLKQEFLPQSLSRVAMSYRTNEWAKHLESADVPEVEALQLEQHLVETEPTKEDAEVAAPVNVEELQQTLGNTAPPPARSASQMSNIPPNLPRSSSSMSKTNPSPYLSRPETANSEGAISRSTSQLSVQGPPPQSALNPRGMSFRSSTLPLIPQQIVESPIEDDSGSPHSPNFPGSSRSAASPFGSASTLMSQRDNILRSKSSNYISSTLTPTPELSRSQFPIAAPASDAGSIYNHTNTSSILANDDNMSLSARRELIRQNSLQSITPTAPLIQTPVPFDTHQPRRQSSVAHPLAREQQLASWRASIQNEFQSTVPPQVNIERQRSQLWMEKKAEGQRKMMEEKMKGARDSAFDQRMRRGDMLSAHKEALRKMQADANKHAS